MGRQPRLLSCHFCRVRKLRCNREFPCSNCTSRGVACSSVNRPVPSKKPSQAAAHSELLNRLEKVEALLAARVDDRDGPPPSATSEGSSPLAPAVVTPASRCGEGLPPKLQNLMRDVAFIDRACFGMKIGVDVYPEIEDNLVVQTCPIHVFMQRASSTCHIYHTHSSASQWMKSTKYIWVPNRPEAEVLVHKYLTTIRHINNIAHAPSLMKIFNKVYDNLEQGSTQAPAGSIILLLAIFAMVTYMWTTEDEPSGLFSDYREANAQSALWIKLVFDAIDGCRRKADVSLECVQGLIIISTALLNIEGFTSRACSMLYRAVAISKELGLHRLDHARNTSAHPDGPAWTGIQAEVGRRVWWHLAATDWVLACCSGPQRGTYSINPLHMAVSKPLNLNDEDATEERLAPLPYDVPSSMTYSIQRLRFAEEIRGLVDRAPLIGLDPYAIGYEHILDADAAIERFLQTTPPFLLLRADSHERLPPGDADISQSLRLQRYSLTLFVYGQRCRLHLPYFVRGSVEPEYSYSRRVALRSAQIIVDTETAVREGKHNLGLSRFKLGLVTYSYLMAVTILTLDLCQLTDENVKAVKLRELEGPWKILEEVQSQSCLINGGIEQLKQVMQKHGIWFSGQADSQSPLVQTNGHANEVAAGQNEGCGMNVDQSMGTRPSMTPSLGPSKETGSGMDANVIDWDNLLWVLEAPFL